MKLLYGASDEVAQWVAQRIEFVGAQGFGPCAGIGVVGSDGRALAGVVFHDYQPGFSTIAFSIASSSPKWITRSIIRDMLRYPFEEVKVHKLWTSTPHRNARALRLAKGLGFTREAVLARQFGKEHAVINRMFLSDFLRLYGAPPHGQANPAAAA